MPDNSLKLEAEIRRHIAMSGSIPVSRYMSLCLTHPEHGYYMQRDPLGARGDFTTAPEISQMFGELIGLWSAAVWRQMGEPENLRIIELGPGRGTMMLDLVRAAHALPAFRQAIVMHLVEISPVLEQRQRRALGGSDIHVEWHQSLEQVPPGPCIILANEFFDAMPVQQAVMCDDGWHERVIKLDEAENLQFGSALEPIPMLNRMLPTGLRNPSIGDIFEWRADQLALELGRRVERSHGAALVIDYGHTESAFGDTLQAVGAHSYADPLVAPGSVDLTAHVDFQALAHAAESMGACAHGPVDQADFLRNIGIDTRAANLQKLVLPGKAVEIDAARARLTSTERTGMGRLFKAIGFSHPKLGPLPGF